MKVKISIFFVLVMCCLLIFSCQEKTKNNNNNNQPSVEDTSETSDSPEKEDNTNSKVNENITNNKAEENTEDNFEPFLKNNNKKFRIAVVQSGEFGNYFTIFKNIYEAFIEFNWIKDKTIFDDPEAEKTVKTFIDKLNTTDYSDYLEFPKELFFSFDWLPEYKDKEKFKEIINNNNVDLIISLGTLSSEILSQYDDDNFKTPVMALGISDPIGANIIDSYEDSGKDYLTVMCNPDRFVRQVRLFHDIVNFKTLGIIYPDTEKGRFYGAVKDVNKVAEEKGFKIIENTNVTAVKGEMPDNPTEEQKNEWEEKRKKAREEYLEAIEDLAQKVDAIYFGIYSDGYNIENINEIMKIIHKYKIPTFSMEGSKFVKHGVLFSIGYTKTGIFNAKNIIRIFKGKKARSLKQLYDTAPSLAVNMEEAEIIGFNIPSRFLGSANEIYKKITKYKE